MSKFKNDDELKGILKMWRVVFELTNFTSETKWINL